MLCSKFNDNVDNLPNNLISIIFGNYFDKSIDNLPYTIKNIEFRIFDDSNSYVSLFDKPVYLINQLICYQKV